MATKLELMAFERVGDTILKLAGVDSFEASRFDVVVYAPDDRRSDQAIEGDRGLRQDLSDACTRALDAYLATLAAFLKEDVKQLEKLKGEEQAKFRKQFSARLYQAATEAAKTMETAILRNTQKIWKSAARGDSALKGVDFEPILVPFLAAIGYTKASAKADEEEDDGDDVGLALVRVQITLDGVNKQILSRSLKALPKAPGDAKKVNETLAAVKKDYEAGARESQKDNPETSGDEEADEQGMNEALFAEHGPAITKAYYTAMDVYISFTHAADDCAAAAKEISRVIKAANKVLQRNSATEDKAMQSSLAALGKAARELLGLQAELKKAFRPLNNTLGILDALKAGKGAALGLLDRAVLDLPNPAKDLEGLAKVVDENRLGSRIG